MNKAIYNAFRKTFIVAILSSGVLFSSLFASHTSRVFTFSGNWKLNTSLSRLGVEFTLAPQTLTVNQEDNLLELEKVINMMGEVFTQNEKYTLDGVECINAGFMEMQKKSTTVWSEDGNSLIINSSMDFNGSLITITETFTMQNGNLVIEYVSQSDMGELVETYVYDKE